MADVYLVRRGDGLFPVNPSDLDLVRKLPVGRPCKASVVQPRNLAFHRRAFALMNMLGLVCDPVHGLVEIPCVYRNAGGVAQAITAAQLALSGVTCPIPCDEMILAMKDVGDAMPTTLRETGGNRTHAANLLGIAIRTLRNKINSYTAEGYDVPDPPQPPAASA